MPDILATDELTYILGFTAAIAFLLHSYLIPQSLVHPIVLGRQSEVERVRLPGESAIYRNYGTGALGRLPLRPTDDILTVSDLIKVDRPVERTLWSTKISNSGLRARVSALSTGFLTEISLQPRESNVLLLLNDGLDFLVSDMALASLCIPSFTISSLTLLSAVLESHPPSAIILHVHFLHKVLELIAENREYAHHTLIVVGEGDLPNVVEKVQVKIRWLADVERKGSKGSVQLPTPDPEDVFSVSFYPGPNNELKATQLTHQNLTAGVTAARMLFPLNGAITPSDRIVSSHSLVTPFGRTIAYTALYEGASFAIAGSNLLFEADEVIPKGEASIIKDIIDTNPTILFMTTTQLNTVVSMIVSIARSSLLYGFAWRHKLFHLQNGYLSNDSIWDRWVLLGARRSVLGGAIDSLRAALVSGGPLDTNTMISARVALSVPVVNVHKHSLVAGPVFFSHPLDLQMFASTEGEILSSPPLAHVGPPSINVEVKLSGVNDDAVESGANPVGEIILRGPSVTLPLEEDAKPYGWVSTGERALAQANGTFKIIHSS